MSQLKKSQHLQIPFKDIEIATKSFQACVGKGGYGWVYKGELLISGKTTRVAVKQLKEQFGQGLKEFLTEIQLLTGQDHPNLISLLGYCDEGMEKIIVYEYAERGSLDQYLRRSTTYTLTWSERLKICVDAARGLDYLHNHVGEHQTIIHRDIKSSNILIDQNWVAKISDLGLSRLSLAGLDRSDVISHVCGTRGYCEPEYFDTGIVKKESDVYSFGMVLFEVFCGRLCTVLDNDGFLLSSKLVRDYYKKKKLVEIVDPSLREQISSDSMNKFLAIAYRCLEKDREQRPPMDVVMKELEESLEIHRLGSSSSPPSDAAGPKGQATDPQRLNVFNQQQEMAMRQRDNFRLIGRVYEQFEPMSEWRQEHDYDTLLVYLPGFQKEYIKVMILRLSFVRVNGECWVSENKWRSFQRDFKVPENCETEVIRSKFDGGILTITMPRKIITAPATTATRVAPKAEEQPFRRTKQEEALVKATKESKEKATSSNAEGEIHQKGVAGNTDLDEGKGKQAPLEDY